MGFDIGGAISGGFTGFQAGGWPGAIAGAGIGGFAGGAEDQAGDAAVGGIDDQIAFERESRDIALNLNKPYMDAGYSALNAMLTMTNLPTVRPADVGAASGGNLVPVREGDLIERLPDVSGSSEEWNLNHYNRWLAQGGLQDIFEKYGKGSQSDLSAAFDDLDRWRRQSGDFKSKHLKYHKQILSDNVGNWDVLAEQNRRYDPAGEEAYDWQTDPGYAFRLAEGEKALERRQSAGGNYLSGGAIREAMRYGQDYASNEFQRIYDRLGVIAGFGSSGTGGATQVLNASGARIGDAYASRGFQRASNYTNDAKNINNAGNQIFTAAGTASTPDWRTPPYFG